MNLHLTSGPEVERDQDHLNPVGAWGKLGCGRAKVEPQVLADHPGLLVGSANQLQGLERLAVVVMHPLAGYRDASGFTADTGRACVMLSRHRAHLTVILDDRTRDVLAAADSTAPGVAGRLALTDDLLTTPTP